MFEGSEKKVEITFSLNSLMERPHSFWEKILQKCQAKILSHRENPQMRAYLLSESSLFVWPNRVLIITCGTTPLVRAIEELTTIMGRENVLSLIFQRKNECFGQRQPSSFFDDHRALNAMFPGVALRMGHYDSHHLLVYCLGAKAPPRADDHTYEALSYNLQKPFLEFFSHGPTGLQVQQYLSLGAHFPHFLFDDHVFTPCGYSLNGLWESHYLTIHTTPLEAHSYSSFETSLPFEKIQKFLDHFFNLQGPESIDMVSYHPQDSHEILMNNYQLLTSSEGQLPSGHYLKFRHYRSPERARLRPVYL